MATYTEHYNLKKPQPSEYYAIADFNGNADVIDTELFNKVDKVTGKGLSTNDYTNADKTIVDGVTSALAGKADVSSVPTKTSDLTNDSGFITNTVNNLINYYLKTETYSKTEVDALLQAITTLDIQAVSQLPTTNISTTTIYLVPKQDPQVPDIKDEYINLDGTTSGWELIGNTQIDLSNYVTTSDLTTALQSYATKAYVEGLTALHDIGADYDFADLTAEQKVTWFTNWTDTVNFPALYGSGVLIPSKDPSQKGIIYVIIGADGNGEVYTNAYKNGAWGKWNGNGLTYGIYVVNDATDIKDFIKKLITQAHSDLATKKAYTLYNIFSAYVGTDNFYGTIERQDTAGYAFSLSKASGDNIYQGYYDISSDYINVIRFDGTAI